MSPRRSKEERDRELAAHYHAHKDEGEWEPVSVQKPRKVGMVYSIRFTGDELESLRIVAEREGKRISDVVHEALADYLAAKNEHGHRLETDFNRRRTLVFQPSVLSQTNASWRPEVNYEIRQVPRAETAAG